MKRFLKIFKWTAIVIVALVGILVIVIASRQNLTYEAPYPDIKASTDSTIIARGKYLANGPAHCSECHGAPEDFSKMEAGEEVPLGGGFPFATPVGTFYASNISSDAETGIGNLTDGEIARTLRYGIGSDGRAIIDFMPFYDLSDADLTAVISYLRTLPAVTNEVADHDFNVMGKIVKAFMLKPMGDGDVPPSSAADSTAEYGQYLAASVANCYGCHTNRDMMTGKFIGTPYAGGGKFEVFGSDLKPIPNKYLIPPNLTSDPTSRIHKWSREQFINRFRQGRVIEGSAMPWGPFSRMSDLELVALYKFFASLPPTKNEIPIGVQDGDPMSID